MPENMFFMHRIRRNNGTVDKGIEVKETYDAALQSYHAYMGAYAYGHQAGTDYVSCMITDLLGGQVLLAENWVAPAPEE